MVSKIWMQFAFMMALMVVTFFHTASAAEAEAEGGDSEPEGKNGVTSVESSMATLAASVIFAIMAKAIRQ